MLVKDDIVLNEGVAYTVALIKDTLRNLKIQVEDDTENDEDESNLFKVSKVTDDEADKIFADFEYVYGTEDEEFTESVGVAIHMGTESTGKLVLHFESESGNVLDYKKILHELRSKFAYAIHQQWKYTDWMIDLHLHHNFLFFIDYCYWFLLWVNW